MPWSPPLSSGASAIIASVVSINPAIEAAFWRAVRVTLVGSMTPAATRSSNFSVAALKPKLSLSSARIFSTITAPSLPALPTIWRSGSSTARLMMLTPIARQDLRRLELSRTSTREQAFSRRRQRCLLQRCTGMRASRLERAFFSSSRSGSSTTLIRKRRRPLCRRLKFHDRSRGRAQPDCGLFTRDDASPEQRMREVSFSWRWDLLALTRS